MKRFITILTLVLVALTASAKDKVDEDVRLDNVDVSRQKTTFTITYDISLGKDLRSCTVNMLLSTDAGQTYTVVDRKNLSGDIGRINSSGRKSISYDFSQDVENLAGRKLAFKVEVAGKDVVKREILVAGQVAVYPHLSYGLMFGMVWKWGWYAKVRSDFCFPSSSYECSSAQGRFWGTGESQISRLNVTVGGMVHAAKWLYPYLGLGYGSYGLYWQDADTKWASVSDYSTKGLSVDAGVVIKAGKVAITAGISNTMFKYTEAEVGIGIMF